MSQRKKARRKNQKSKKRHLNQMVRRRKSLKNLVMRSGQMSRLAKEKLLAYILVEHSIQLWLEHLVQKRKKSNQICWMRGLITDLCWFMLEMP
jgi:hypothetical protein